MYSNSTSAERFAITGTGYTTGLTESDSTLLLKTTTATSYALTSNTYLNFRGRSASSGTCTLTGAEVELDTF